VTRLAAFAALAALAACAGPGDSAAPAVDYAASGPHPVGHVTASLDAGGRSVPLEIWYPAGADGPAGALEDFGADADQRATLASLLATAPAGCPTATTAAGRDAAPAAGTWPLVVFSHCHECARFSSFSLAEHLASHGLAVAAPEHVGDTLYEGLDDSGLGLDTDTLALRVGDMAAALDLLLGAGEGLPEDLRGRFDADRVGSLGHSFGAVTAGLLAQDDGRISAAAALAAPMENPLLPGVSIAALEQPLLFVVAVEDNSITELGNVLIRENFDAAIGEAWKVEVADAGHWSFSDICGLTEDLMPGCGEDTRQTDPDETFTYLPPSEGLPLAAGYAAAFFARALRGEDAALEASPGVEVASR